MNKYVKKLLLGLLIWAVPFISSFFIWDVENNMPSVSMPWFNSIMAFTWAVGFAIALYLYFKDKESDGWEAGIIWYIELIVLDLLILVWAFGMSAADYYPMLIMYLNTLVIAGVVGMVKNK
jgi:hypothetical protein